MHVLNIERIGMLKTGAYRLVLALLVLTGCTTMGQGPEGETRYRYSTFDFSGKSWTLQKERCSAQGMKPKHLDTECGFLLCTSRYSCETNP